MLSDCPVNAIAGLGLLDIFVDIFLPFFYSYVPVAKSQSSLLFASLER